jgi:hypothetical protein
MGAEEVTRDRQRVEGRAVDIINPKLLDAPFDERDDPILREILVEIGTDRSDCEGISEAYLGHLGLAMGVASLTVSEGLGRECERRSPRGLIP